MELEKRKNTKCAKINPGCIKDININSVNLFDTNLNEKKNNSYNNIFKFKRNFK